MRERREWGDRERERLRYMCVLGVSTEGRDSLGRKRAKVYRVAWEDSLEKNKAEQTPRNPNNGG